MTGNKNLRQANKSKKDEFYTQLVVDIENEMRHYKEHLATKTNVLCMKNKMVFALIVKSHLILKKWRGITSNRGLRVEKRLLKMGKCFVRIVIE